MNPSYVGDRPDIIGLIDGHPTRILDVGCSCGKLGRSLKELYPDTTVWGIDGDREMIAEASTCLDHAISADLDRVDLAEIAVGQPFDCVIAADILEHLRDPWDLLRQIRLILAPRGQLITSIPNVRHWSTLWSLACDGRWPCRERGIHDRTHLRFFARCNMIEMFERCGFDMVEEKRNIRLWESGGPPNSLAWLLDLPPFRPFFVFQYLHRCVSV